MTRFFPAELFLKLCAGFYTQNGGRVSGYGKMHIVVPQEKSQVHAVFHLRQVPGVSGVMAESVGYQYPEIPSPRCFNRRDVTKRQR